MTSYTRYLPLVVAPRAGLLALHPLFVTGMTRPIVGGDGGISIAVVNDHAQGALFVIDPWVSILEGDTIDVFLDAQIVYHHVVTATEVDQRLFFYVEAGRFVPGWIEQCYYLLLRKGETAPDDPSVALRLRVKLDRPAGPDREPHKPGHSELKIAQLPEEVIRQGVDAEWAAKGVPMTLQPYPNIALRDTVQVKWGSVFLKPLVLTQAHVDGTQPIVITADQGEILAGGDSAALLIQYEVYDEVWNYSEKWSIPTTVNVDAGAWRLEQPIIKESVNGVIDLKGLNQQDVTVQIHVRTEDFELGDTITMTWIGTPQIGKPLIHTQSRDITNVPSILELKVPYEEVRAIAMGSADASYVLTKKNGGPPLSSKRTFADVIGDGYAHPAPTIREVVGEVLEPDVMYATVDISYLGMTDGDVIELMWDGSLSSGAPYLHTEQHTVSRNEAADKLITIYILDEHISVLANGRLTLWYRVSNDNAAYGVSESERLLVKVQAIAATLPAPQVPEAPDGVLDPSKVFDKVTVRIDYTGTVKDDILTYYWTAISSAISTSDWLPITTVSAGKPVNFRVDASYVTPSIGQYVKIRYTLKHASTQLLSYSATLNLQIGQRVGDLPPPEVVQAANGSLDPIVATNGVDVIVKYDNMDPALDTIALKWRGTPGPGTSVDLELPAHASGRVQFHLPATFIGPNIGKSVAVSYDVKRYNFWNTSELLTLDVLRFQNPETQLPRPEVPQAIAGVLDLMAFSGNPDVVVQKWPFIALGQRLWLRLEGKTIAGADHRIVLLDGVLVTAGQVSNGLKEILSRTELLKLAHASAATVLCKVAFDGANDESSAIAFPLLPLTVRTRYDYVTPVITQVSDSRGEVAEGGLTFDKQVTLKGTATRGEKVELYDGSTSLGSADVGTNGTWERLLTNLTVKNYHITAHALYDADPVSSLLRAFTVEAAITPTIDSVKDSKGADVPLNGATFDTSVTVTGKASPDQAVQLYDGSTPIAPVTPVDSNGDWSKTFTGLSVAAHTIKAKARYGTEPESTARTFTVLQTVTPTITGVSDSKGEVPLNGTTFDTSVTVSGNASPNQAVQLYDGSTPFPSVTQVNGNGDWSQLLPGLSVAPHTIKAKARYGTEPESTARTFTVLQTVTPTITGVSDSKGEVPLNGTTFDTSVTVSGNASPNQAVQLYDGSTPFPSVTQVNGNGDWSQ
ncbi:Ig-like domain-containing protein, partial [Pseudomonas sp. OV226]|uniref:Ig-like domain-containing protein n=1 Tax=Pseudomonas sp. OV226 TaxID=2135588 RepID=UPI000D6AF111